MELIKEIDLVHRYVYRIKSRNLVVGVWDETAHGFMGIRRKFESEYLFMEYHWDYNTLIGTVRAMELIEPATWWQGEIRPYAPTVCKHCGVTVTYIRYIEKVGGKMGEWRHDEDGEFVHDIYPIAAMYQPLFDFLEPFHRAELARLAELDA